MDNLLLLHGALGSAATLNPIKQALQDKYNVYTLDFSGHGGLAIPDEPYSMQLFSNDIKELLDKEGIEQAHIFGYSMGGYAALYFALQYPNRVSSIFTLATKFAWSPEAAEKESKMLNPEKIEQKVPAFAQTLTQRHSPQDWKQVMLKTAEMMHQLGAAPALTSENLPQLHIPVCVGVGDKDNMVTVEETLWAYRLLPNASMLVLPDTRHPLETVSVARITSEIEQFTGSKTLHALSTP
ncbi:alpha/beta fold hydrolase [Pontibacter cellulosilyticus]|uniref:Alpha/beta hydrolase n=1 Tax=Pontibacter cellulosilyticus TaxID=1720253 RepID=A0A923SJV2_9BACT|nr:alpha/beta hydrolase [Pontibacter cellulosilyticus]MBC5994057.1 alpha/beta hydrolase [Pontibacter cellulosilyticus]